MSPAGTKIGEQPNDKEGTKVGEPKLANGRLWQNVDFDGEVDGWVAANLIIAVVMPSPIPTPVAVECAQGELPLLDPTKSQGWWGVDRVSIGDGETHTYCFTVNTDRTSLSISVIDRTNAAQCFLHTDEFIPPADSGWRTVTYGGGNTTYGFSLRSGFVPRGPWRIRITAGNTPDCADRYQVLAH